MKITKAIQNAKNAWYLFKRDKAGVLGLVILMAFLLVAVLGSVVMPVLGVKLTESPDILQAPSWEHILGTDEIGHDLLIQVVQGTGVSMLVGTLAGLMSIIIGTAIGLVAGYYGGRAADEALMRFTDMFLCLPWLPLMIILAVFLGPNIWNIIFIIAISSWAGTARLVRSQTLSIRERSFVEGIRAINGSDSYIIYRHILPSVLPICFANMVLQIALAILSESTLSFLGLGDPLHMSWGMIIHYAFASGAVSAMCWWYIVPPGLMIMLAVLGFTFSANALDEVLNPKFRKI